MYGGETGISFFLLPLLYHDFGNFARVFRRNGKESVVMYISGLEWRTFCSLHFDAAASHSFFCTEKKGGKMAPMRLQHFASVQSIQRGGRMVEYF